MEVLNDFHSMPIHPLGFNVVDMSFPSRVRFSYAMCNTLYKHNNPKQNKNINKI